MSILCGNHQFKPERVFWHGWYKLYKLVMILLPLPRELQTLIVHIRVLRRIRRQESFADK